jgi:chemotaxis protein histidine kinase CheA
MKDMIYAYLKEQVGTDDMTLLDSFYEEYCKTIEEKIVNLKAALESKDFEALRKLTHALKGDSAIVGDEPMREHALAFENGAKANDLNTCQAELEEVIKLAPQR